MNFGLRVQGFVDQGLPEYLLSVSEDVFIPHIWVFQPTRPRFP